MSLLPQEETDSVNKIFIEKSFKYLYIIIEIIIERAKIYNYSFRKRYCWENFINI
jgi:hypothetical protein